MEGLPGLELDMSSLSALAPSYTSHTTSTTSLPQYGHSLHVLPSPNTTAAASALFCVNNSNLQGISLTSPLSPQQSPPWSGSQNTYTTDTNPNTTAFTFAVNTTSQNCTTPNTISSPQAATKRRRNVGVPKFLRFLYQMLENEDPSIISWAHKGTAFQIKQPDILEQVILPKYFKHNKVSSFQRQLNYFGFKKWTKTQTKICTFSHIYFQRGDKALMKKIKRKERTNSNGDCVMEQDETLSIDQDKNLSSDLKNDRENIKREQINKTVDQTNRPNKRQSRALSGSSASENEFHNPIHPRVKQSKHKGRTSKSSPSITYSPGQIYSGSNNPYLVSSNFSPTDHHRDDSSPVEDISRVQPLRVENFASKALGNYSRRPDMTTDYPPLRTRSFSQPMSSIMSQKDQIGINSALKFSAMQTSAPITNGNTQCPTFDDLAMMDYSSAHPNLKVMRDHSTTQMSPMHMPISTNPNVSLPLAMMQSNRLQDSTQRYNTDRGADRNGRYLGRMSSSDRDYFDVLLEGASMDDHVLNSSCLHSMPSANEGTSSAELSSNPWNIGNYMPPPSSEFGFLPPPKLKYTASTTSPPTSSRHTRESVSSA